MVGESRSELLKWLNSTLDTSYTKVEQCGNGAAYCQLMDSIYLDVPMNRVNFDAKSEYDYSTNMKILQAAFQRHRVTRIIDVDRLIKCRLQDNLELLQWFKKYWMEKKDFNVDYDPNARRRAKAPAKRVSSVGSAGSSAGTTASASTGIGSRVSSSTRAPSRTASAGASSTTVPRSTSNGPTLNRVASNGNIASNAKVQHLTNQLADARKHIEDLTDELQHVKEERDPLEIERNFFYNKLISIEELVNATRDALDAKQDQVQLGDRSIGTNTGELIEEVYAILCATQEGFEISVQEDEDMSVEVGNDRFNLEAETF